MFKEAHSDDDRKDSDISEEKTSTTLSVPSTEMMKQSSPSSFWDVLSWYTAILNANVSAGN